MQATNNYISITVINIGKIVNICKIVVNKYFIGSFNFHFYILFLYLQYLRLIFNVNSMFTTLIEASKREIKRGAYKLAFDEQEKIVKVLYSKSGQLSYIISGENDEMLFSTIIYFGLRN